MNPMNSRPTFVFLLLVLGCSVSAHAQAELISKGQSGWRYHDGASPPPADWTTNTFDDSSWATGQAPLGYDDDGIRTEISYGEDQETKHPTAFFRLTFQGKASDQYFGVNASVDDGAVFHLNGKRIGSVRMRDDEETPYHGIKVSDATARSFAFVSFKRDLLVEGDNVLAVSVHQANGSSGDLFLDAELLELSLKDFGKLKRQRIALDYQLDLAEINNAFAAKRQDWIATYRAAESDEEREALAQNQPSPDDEIARINRLIDLYSEAPPTVNAIGTLMSFGAVRPKHIDVLLEYHIQSEKLTDLCMAAMYAPDSARLLEAIMESSPHAKVKGAAAFARAKQLSNAQNPKHTERIVKLASQAVDQLGDTQLGSMAKGLLFEAKNLAIGMTAPEIVGTDLEDVEFKLSEYRGKVVVLDFWGDW